MRILPCLLVALVLARAAIAGPDPAKLAQTRVDLAAKLYKELSGDGFRDHVHLAYDASLRWLDAVLRIAGSDASKRTSALGDHLDRMRKLEPMVKALADHGLAGPVDVDEARLNVVEAELWVADGHR
jgi:hypothetical protein